MTTEEDLIRLHLRRLSEGPPSMTEEDYSTLRRLQKEIKKANKMTKEKMKE